MKDMASVVQELIAQQTHIFELLGDDRIPTPRPPITAFASGPSRAPACLRPMWPF